jgi:hypothetical protein
MAIALHHGQRLMAQNGGDIKQRRAVHGQVTGTRMPQVVKPEIGNFVLPQRLVAYQRAADNKYPPAEPEVLRLLAPQRGLTAIEKSKSKTERTTNCIIPELSNFGSPPAEPGVYLD